MQVLNLQDGVGSSIIHMFLLENHPLIRFKTGCSSSTVLFKPVAPFFREDINISRGGDLMGVDMFLLDSQDDLKNAKSIVNWVLDYVTGPQFDFDPVKYEYCKQSPRQLYFSMKDGMTHLHR
ncbi:hypothetical protein IGI04_029550 [Brassica rapa subsp. trilocularis]|uniref:Uncharacterized protein n=1 Tax=Brassica rapa subsp. trilocularis TaxID=1813537 RepID=A0ABQ7LN57_BRACM|nr:hypothetical protein IGI04_029550 [Brassica rapa subsp. trilocularis]